MKYKTFGNFLGNIMKKRNLSALRLAELTGNKSKTTVIRLLNDDCGSRAIMKFAEVLPEALELDEHEIEEKRASLHTKYLQNIGKPRRLFKKRRREKESHLDKGGSKFLFKDRKSRRPFQTLYKSHARRGSRDHYVIYGHRRNQLPPAQRRLRGF